MKVAISHWQDRISPVFDVAEELLLVDIEVGLVVGRRCVSLSHGEPFTRASEMVALGVELLVCGAISLDYEKVLIQSGIHVVGFCCGEVEAVLVALKKGSFGARRFRMPGFNGQKVKFGGNFTASTGRGKRHRANRRGY